MKKRLLFLFFISALCAAQSGTEVYVFDLIVKNEAYSVTNGVNLSQNDGYDNQPSFVTDTTLLYTSTRERQTDLVLHHLGSNKKKWITNTPKASEYSPLLIPNETAVSAIELKLDGKQLLYKYPLNETLKATPIFEDLIVGYHAWYSQNIVVSFVLGDPAKLIVSSLESDHHHVIDQNIGRSIHKIPNSNLMSYVKKENSHWEIRSLDPLTGKTDFICKTLDQVEDLAWTPDGTILMGKDATLYAYHPKKDTTWKPIASLSSYFITGITRLAVSPSGSKLAVVVKESPETIVEKHLAAINSKNIEAILATIDTAIEVYQNNNPSPSKGLERLKNEYQRIFKRFPNVQIKVLERIVYKNKVIDKVKSTVGTNQNTSIILYEIKNNRIIKQTVLTQ